MPKTCAKCRTTESRTWHFAPKAYNTVLDAFPAGSRFCSKCNAKAYNDARRADPVWLAARNDIRRAGWAVLSKEEKKAKASQKLKGGKYYEAVQATRRERRKLGLTNIPAARERRARWVKAHPEQHFKIRKARESTRENQYAALHKVSRMRNSDRRTFKVILTFEEFCLKRGLPCTYCRRDLGPTGTQMDRKDNSIPEYSVENAVPCCTDCNTIKRDCLSHDDMMAYHDPTLVVGPDSPRSPLVSFREGKTKPLSLRKRFGRLAARMRSLGGDLDLTFEDYKSLAGPGACCHYCTGPLSATGYNLDRRDNSKLYTKENVVPCCPVCNSVKGDVLTEEQMLTLVRKVTLGRQRAAQLSLF